MSEQRAGATPRRGAGEQRGCTLRERARGGWGAVSARPTERLRDEDAIHVKVHERGHEAERDVDRRQKNDLPVRAQQVDREQQLWRRLLVRSRARPLAATPLRGRAGRCGWVAVVARALVVVARVRRDLPHEEHADGREDGNRRIDGEEVQAGLLTRTPFAVPGEHVRGDELERKFQAEVEGRKDPREEAGGHLGLELQNVCV